MKSLNIGILAHVDAGKTSLTERLLYNAGVIKTLGSVDKGNTQTDSMVLERQRGITIKSAVVSFDVGNLKVNLIDTPGHPDFIAEVERSLGVLDAVILVISAVEGVQSQTSVLMRALIKLRIPTLVFINKLDRMGARSTELVESIKTKLFPHVITMSSVKALGTSGVEVADRTHDQEYTEELQATLADNNEAFLADLVHNPNKLDGAICRQEMVAQIGRMQLCPVFFGSATKGVGVDELTKALEEYLTPLRRGSSSLSAVIFKIDRGLRDEKVAYARIYSGTIQQRQQIELNRVDPNGLNIRLTAKTMEMQLFKNGTTIAVSTAVAGDIVKIWGLSDCAINDYIGERPPHIDVEANIARPSLETVVVPSDANNGSRLFSALQRISEQDPFVEVRQNAQDNVLSVRLYGEVQKEVIEYTLTNSYGIAVEFRATTTICIERVVGTGAATEIGKHGDPYLGTVGLRIEPGDLNSGIQYKLSREVLGTMPAAFFVAIEEAVHETLHEGIYGWQVTDCIVTLTHTGYWPRQSHAHATFDKSMSSTAGDFRAMTPLALMGALSQAATEVFEPLSRFELEVPDMVIAQVLQSLVAAEAKFGNSPTTQQGVSHITGSLPVRRTHDFERSLPDLSQGEGTFTAEFGGYQKVQGSAPISPRTDNNPLNREEYLRRTFKRQ